MNEIETKEAKTVQSAVQMGDKSNFSFLLF